MDSDSADAWPIDVWAQRNGISRSQAYKEAKSGRLTVRKVGARSLVTREDGAAWRQALPKMPAGPVERCA